MRDILLRTLGLQAFYGDFQALYGIDFEIDRGEVVAIIGANGAGKSTFLKAITGLVPVARAMAHYEGRPIGGLPASELVRRGIAMVPEGRRIFPSLSVEENLRIGGFTKRPGEWTLARVYELFPVLKERRSHPGTALSGGQQQMVAIGRALMANPRLLICDELSLGLAPVVIQDIYAAMAPILAGGMSVILVEQDVATAKRCSDRLYCFQEGRVSLAGRSAELGMEQITNAYFGTEPAAC